MYWTVSDYCRSKPDNVIVKNSCGKKPRLPTFSLETGLIQNSETRGSAHFSFSGTAVKYMISFYFLKLQFGFYDHSNVTTLCVP